ncbi:unnamed protein product [Aphanomyces euteiches]|uniref:Dynein regulatory complex protein 10 n=1 Tax=Aphanomyces euteiches TaxID=100861 RepID=A0A6G0WX76_9STRA|nr:hypothetical protein Ae201684_010747 [Aphanomyces euteiches]KAH9061450.1 hypothetical protein Ae201684P_020786 [Aphanomyces euteiches]KAH9127463.1 hypothetical protein AeMF1_002239 [Aphanomyces euteiches]KAH9133052.1 hypothetical protein LEN26_007177 [Aphanomyces euteiches]KAH9155675.1 hypothetical protein AeRB84_002366 [Aphanomyces euteiches]
MSKVTGAEGLRLLSLLDEVVEKLQLLAHFPALSMDVEANHMVVLAQQHLVQHLAGDAATLLHQHFTQEEALLSVIHGGRLDLLHDNNQEMTFSAAKQLTRSLCRCFRHDPKALVVATIEKPHGRYFAGSTALVSLSGLFTAMRELAAHALSTSVEQDEAQKVLLNDLEIRIREAENDHKQIAMDVSAQREARDADFRRNAQKIQALTNELHDIEQGADQAATLIEQESKQAEFALLNGYEDKVTRGRDESDGLTTTVNKLREEFHTQEEGHRKRKLKAAVEVSNQIEQYDKDMLAIQAQIDQLRADMAGEVAEIHRLSNLFARLDENNRLAAIDHKRWDDEESARLASEQAFLRRLARVQAAFRGYLVRKHLAEAKKRKKGKKKKGKKGSKKKK